MSRKHDLAYAGMAIVELATLFHFMFANDPVHAIFAFSAAGLHALLCGGKRRCARRVWKWRGL